jgi:hypothetical protein
MKSEKMYLSVFIKKMRSFHNGPKVLNFCKMLDVLLATKGDFQIDLDQICKHYGIKI